MRSTEDKDDDGTDLASWHLGILASRLSALAMARLLSARLSLCFAYNFIFHTVVSTAARWQPGAPTRHSFPSTLPPLLSINCSREREAVAEGQSLNCLAAAFRPVLASCRFLGIMPEAIIIIKSNALKGQVLAAGVFHVGGQWKFLGSRSTCLLNLELQNFYCGYL